MPKKIEKTPRPKMWEVAPQLDLPESLQSLSEARLLGPRVSAANRRLNELYYLQGLKPGSAPPWLSGAELCEFSKQEQKIWDGAMAKTKELQTQAMGWEVADIMEGNSAILGFEYDLIKNKTTRDYDPAVIATLSDDGEWIAGGSSILAKEIAEKLGALDQFPLSMGYKWKWEAPANRASIAAELFKDLLRGGKLGEGTYAAWERSELGSSASLRREILGAKPPRV